MDHRQRSVLDPELRKQTRHPGKVNKTYRLSMLALIILSLSRVDIYLNHILQNKTTWSKM